MSKLSSLQSQQSLPKRSYSRDSPNSNSASKTSNTSSESALSLDDAYKALGDVISSFSQKQLDQEPQSSQNNGQEGITALVKALTGFLDQNNTQKSVDSDAGTPTITLQLAKSDKKATKKKEKKAKKEQKDAEKEAGKAKKKEARKNKKSESKKAEKSKK